VEEVYGYTEGGIGLCTGEGIRVYAEGGMGMIDETTMIEEGINMCIATIIDETD